MIFGSAHDQRRAWQVPANAAEVGVHFGAQVRILQEGLPVLCREYKMEVDLNERLRHGAILHPDCDVICGYGTPSGFP